MNHGEVWTVVDPETSMRWRLAVVSGDGWNDRPEAWPYVVPLVRRSGGYLPPYVAELTDPDPVGGVALVAELGRVDPAIAVERVGMLTGASMPTSVGLCGTCLNCPDGRPGRPADV